MLQSDIMTWDYTAYAPGPSTSSPHRRCAVFGAHYAPATPGAKSRERIPDIEAIGKPMMDRTREIIAYLQPRYFWIENPQTSRMKHYITDLPYYDSDYCMYSDWGYRKRTRAFWTDIPGFEAQVCTHRHRHRGVRIRNRQAAHIRYGGHMA
jgi:hypothetical protein